MSVSLHAESPDIDESLESCIAADMSTAGVTNCAYAAYASWDKALNAIYQQLMSSLSATARQRLRESQRQWIRFRDAEFKAIDAIYEDREGTMYIPMRVGDRMEIVKSRVLQLRAYRPLTGH